MTMAIKKDDRVECVGDVVNVPVGRRGKALEDERPDGGVLVKFDRIGQARDVDADDLKVVD